ncbi:toll/interleukin-1 receptor domain-containing protein [Taibaiella chishuiensis]|uniref:TIR domain-containing protein n=1 Tax=Taibaiella chishuiensis TaxID=1434707 RepID=A0A2P8DC42_9BACT|nr:toll/interleukin-1 receptor domain-containing protein [Taibaiella chishuiensis]PSK94784.1 TIR domain-containing protein [Taibaiella chishuiensis]
MLHDVFISYTQPDRNVATYMHDLFQANQLKSWMALSGSNGIVMDPPFETQLVHAIRNSRIFVLIYSDYCNHSDDIIREIRQRNKQHPTVIIRLDDSRYRPDLSYYLEGIQYVKAAHHNLYPAACRVLQEVIKKLQEHFPGLNLPTDKLLFYNGVKLLDDRKYNRSVATLAQYTEIDPDNCDGWFYLALATIGGRKIRKMTLQEVQRLEAMLLPVSGTKETGFISLLLAIIRQSYYAGNGFIVPAPGIEALVDGVVLVREEALVLVMHIDESERSRFQQFLAY